MGKLIGLVGAAQTGKSTIAKHLVQKYGYVRISFIDPLKEMLLNAGMCSREELWGVKTEESRWLMQKIGTEIFRKQVDPEYWVKLAEKKIIEQLETGENIVIDDIRLPDEADVIRRHGGLLVRTVRDGFVDSIAGGKHESEMHVMTIPVSFEIVAKSGDIATLIEGAEYIDEMVASEAFA